MNENPGTNLDINKIFVDLTQKLITDSAGSIYNKSKNIFKGLSNDVRLKMESSYKNYLACVYERYSKAKSFLIRDESTQLYDFYVPMGITCGKKTSEEASIFNFSVKNHFAVIKGSAGSGKSMMMRYLFLNTIEKQEKVPVFIELRRINDFEGSLLDFIKTQLTENKFALDNDYIEKALKLGHFAVFLDGFDEIAFAKRKQLIKEIKSLATDYDQNIIIVSSRPDNEFSSWNLFDVWEIMPLTLTQALKLIKKVPSKNIDTEARDKFLKDLEKGLFEKHKSFLSNPLLLSIMVITYASSGDVPQKISTFYEKAYIALFEHHDALKGAFKRDRACNLDILEFKKIFSAFSALTSNNMLDSSVDLSNSLRFPKTDALNYIESAKEISDVTNDFNTEDFLQDCIKAVCLLIEDGLEITFAHRSFQEYFTAVFISNLNDAKAQRELLTSYSSAQGFRTIEILHEINPSLVEKSLLIPGLESLEKAIKFQKNLEIENYKTFLTHCLISISFENIGENSKVEALPTPTLEKAGNFMVYIYAFVIRNYISSNEGFLSFSTKSKENIEVILGNIENKAQLSFLEIRKNSELLRIFAKETHWAFSMDKLKSVLQVKSQLIEKHKQIDAARRENLLKGLRRKK